MTRIWCALMLVASAGAQQNASPMKPTPDQLLSMRLAELDRVKVMGDLPGAIKGYEDVLDLVEADSALKNRGEEVLQRLAASYLAAQRPADGIRVSRRILELHAEDCKPAAEWIERCADAQYGLGLALMHAGEFAGAATELTASADNFGKVKMDGDESFRMTKLKQRGDAEALLAAALFRSGKKEQAVATFRKAVATLTIVTDNEKLDPATRGSALRSRTDAEGSLKLLEGK